MYIELLPLIRWLVSSQPFTNQTETVTWREQTSEGAADVF